MLKNLVRSFAAVGLFAGLAASLSAAQIEGTLIDKMCSAKALKNGQSFAASHDKMCALAPPCQKSGYGVFTSDNKFLTFDEAGNAKAVTALKATNKNDNLKVKVDGDVQGDTIKVSSLKLE